MLDTPATQASTPRDILALYGNQLSEAEVENHFILPCDGGDAEYGYIMSERQQPKLFLKP